MTESSRKFSDGSKSLSRCSECSSECRTLRSDNHSPCARCGAVARPFITAPACLKQQTFLTFSGFVAFSIYLPTLLRAQFGLDPADAGFRAAGFVGTGDADAFRWRLAGGSHRRCSGPVVGVRWRRLVLAGPDVAVHGAVHRRRFFTRGFFKELKKP